jgi:PilZ domain-containing protein
MNESRQHTRLDFSLPMEVQVQFTNPDGSWQSAAILMNFSLGGLYFECETLPQVKPGNIAEFTFKAIPSQYRDNDSPIRARAVVKRLESLAAGLANFGVAVEFLTGPKFG